MENALFLAGYLKGQRDMRRRCADLAAHYDNGQFTKVDTWAEGFAFARRMIAQNLTDLTVHDEPTL